jgi:hypothetical protein
MLTREELEDIMNNQPYGAGKKFMKKGVKKTTFIATPYKKNSLEPIVVTVYGSADSKAFQDAQRQFYSTIAKTIDYDGVEWKREV